MIFSATMSSSQLLLLLSSSLLIQKTTSISSSSSSIVGEDFESVLLRGGGGGGRRTAGYSDCSDEIKFISGSSNTYPYKEYPIKILPSSSTSMDEVTFYVQHSFFDDYTSEGGGSGNIDISVGYGSTLYGGNEVCTIYQDVAPGEVMATTQGGPDMAYDPMAYELMATPPQGGPDMAQGGAITAKCLETNPFAIIDILLDGPALTQDVDMVHYESSVCCTERDGKHDAPKKLFSFKIPCGCSQSKSFKEDLQLNEIRSITGTESEYAEVDAELIRLSYPEYIDGTGEMMEMEPNARMISNTCAENHHGGDILNSNLISDMFWLWGQFIDHDVDLTGGSDDNITIISPTCDDPDEPDSICMIEFHRSDFYFGIDDTKPREQPNHITGFLDASNVYGSTPELAKYLRTFRNGRLKVSDGNLLPFNDAGMDNAAPSGSNPEDFFLAGDIRANENLGLTSMHTLFVREHNRIVAKLATAFPNSSDETLYHMGRKIVSATIQRITYNEFLPLLVGKSSGYDFQDMLANYDKSYDSNINPGLANEFSTVAFRVGHTMLSSKFPGLGDDMLLRDAFFRPELLTTQLMTSILSGFVSTPAQEVDTKVVDDVRNFLFGAPVSGVGQDLVAFNIQRGRDHGIPKYNALRVALKMERKATYEDITDDASVQQELQEAYGPDNVDAIDAWVGGISETHANGAMVGELFTYIIGDQFKRLMYGDPMFYKNDKDLIDNESILIDCGINLNTVMLADVLENNLVGIHIDHDDSVMKLGASVETVQE